MGGLSIRTNLHIVNQIIWIPWSWLVQQMLSNPCSLVKQIVLPQRSELSLLSTLCYFLTLNVHLVWHVQIRRRRWRPLIKVARQFPTKQLWWRSRWTRKRHRPVAEIRDRFVGPFTSWYGKLLRCLEGLIHFNPTGKPNFCTSNRTITLQPSFCRIRFKATHQRSNGDVRSKPYKTVTGVLMPISLDWLKMHGKSSKHILPNGG